MTYALIGLCVLLGGLLAPSLVWLHGAQSDKDNLRDRLDATQLMADEYRHGRDVATETLAVRTRELEQEKQLRVIAETQRNEAQAKAHTYLAQMLTHASDKEIQDAVTDMFTVPLSLAPGSELARPGD